MDRVTPNFGFEAAVKVAGGAGRLASRLGVTPQAVSQWRRSIPAARAIQIERALGIPLCLLRPDLHPPGDGA